MKRIVGWRNRYSGQRAYVTERWSAPMEGRRGNPKKYKYVTFKAFGCVYSMHEFEFLKYYEKFTVREIPEG